MRIAYCTNVRLPSERAHGHQIAQVADALDILGHDVTVFAPFRRNPVKDDYHTYYGARAGVRIEHLGTFDPINRMWLPGVTGLWTLNHLLKKNYGKKLEKKNFDLLYTRTPALLPVLLPTGVPVVLELHQLPRLQRQKFVEHCKKCALVACLTTSMRDTLIKWGMPAKKVIAEGDAVDLRRFAKVPSRQGARTSLNLNTNRTVIGYVGRLKTLGMEKGVKYLLEALKQLQPQQKFFGLIVGGPARDTEEYKRMAKDLGLTDEDVLFTGEVPASRIPETLSACNVLAMPFPDLSHYRHHMSPLKMFEYMAAGRPIVTTDLPTVRDILSEENAYFCAPGSSRDLARTLEEIAAHPDAAHTRAEKALELVKNHTWEKRMERILSKVS